MHGRVDTRVRFRTLQAIFDLRAIVRGTPRDTLHRLAASTGQDRSAAVLDRLIREDACTFTGPETLRLHSALVLAATLPSDDYGAFQAATAILLADRLQRGAGEEDLFWHWDAFHEHYRLADQPARGALLRGYHRMHADGLITLEDPPEAETLVTEEPSDVLAGLQGQAGDAASALRAAVEGGDLDRDFWHNHCAPYLAASDAEPFQRAIRHVFETRQDWDPFPDALFDPLARRTAVIPLLAA